jgi:HD superfamily phosphohydrolase
MKSLPIIIPVALFFLLLSTPSHANTSINISNNGDNSHSSVKVNSSSSTGGNYINGQKVEGSNGTNRTVIQVDGETLVDETTEGDNETDIEVKKEGDNKPEVKYEVKKNSAEPSSVKKAVKSVNDEEKKKAVKRLDEIESEMKEVVKKQVPEQTSLLSRLDSLFDKLRSLFGNN